MRVAGDVMKVRVSYSKLGKIRFTGHRDVARIWERTLRKAEVPVAMSTGFTPRLKMAFGLALPTGAESLVELLDVTLADANAYFETVPDSATWTNKTDDQKNRALISATRWIDSLNYLGDRCDEDQALKWPRNNYDVDGVELECSLIPAQIKYATYELARALANDTGAITDSTGTTGLYDEVKLGDLQVKYSKTSQAVGTINN
ncbi:MAG: DUF2344 domain-containing protein, partial [Actinobacteria bacterium]|nr:DUF2344 domain-containing protein [Actinomycetota bacterium]